ncbi:heat-shock protein IbpA [Alcanivorax marinus]|nr:heat-shock protein IbpA [Alloalcanivorax marinus]
MNTLAPLFRHSVGFDRFDDWLESVLRADQSNG